MGTWIDFKELREKIRIADVLQQHNVQLKVRGDKATGLCPLPTHPERHDGKKRSPSFSVHLGRGIWQCFGCHAKGNVLDLGSILLGLDPNDPIQLRQAAVKMAERFLGGDKSCGKPTPVAPGAKSVEKAMPNTDLPIIVNAPLDFELKGLDPHHPYLKRRGFTTETIIHFGLGFCNKGLMKDRIAIPLHDDHGRLIGYAGRLVNDDLLAEENPKYRLPGLRERGGKVYRFEKSRFVYNAFQIGGPVSDLVVVEGFPSVWWLWQNRYPKVVALMGNNCSDEQAGIITDLVVPGGCVWVLSDGDKAGERCATSVLTQIAMHRKCRWAKITEGKQPTDCVDENLKRLLGAH